MSLPRVLIIDDMFGGSLRDRKNFCKNFALIDVTGDEASPLAIHEPLAEAVFESSQIRLACEVQNSVKKALHAVDKGWDNQPHLHWAMVLLDLRFVSGRLDEEGDPEGNEGDDLFGLTILDALHQIYPDLPVVIISSKVRDSIIENCRTRGAVGFIQRHEHSVATKSPREILAKELLENALLQDSRDGARIIGSSLALLKTLRAARRVATGRGSILILGETGVGKELLARYIHDMSPKAKGPYKVFNPGGREESLQASELFGHVKGAFTDAKSEKTGLFEEANGGTLFIDEIGDVPLSLQNKLLRPLENWTVKRQGGKTDIHLDLQVVLATNKDLDAVTKTKHFKNDLLNRLKVYPITIPPLRDRRGDIPLVTEYLLESICRKQNARWPRKILPEVKQRLQSYEWPDNIRELRNLLERAVLNNKDSEVLILKDIDIDSQSTCVQIDAVLDTNKAYVDSDDLSRLLAQIESFSFPRNYEKLHGRLPEIHRATSRFLAEYLVAALEITQRNKPGTSFGKTINVTGAASCMQGEQLPTPRARDLVKRIMHFGRESKYLDHDTDNTHLLLFEAYQEVMKRGSRKD